MDHVVIFARTDIAPGDELTYDYRFQVRGFMTHPRFEHFRTVMRFGILPSHACRKTSGWR